MHNKGNYKQGEKTTLRMEENNSKGLTSKIYNREKTISLTSDAGKTGQPPVKEWN